VSRRRVLLGAISTSLQDERLDPGREELGVGEKEGRYAGSDSESRELVIDDDSSSRSSRWLPGLGRMRLFFTNIRSRLKVSSVASSGSSEDFLIAST
jgi:hypothetical protein